MLELLLHLTGDFLLQSEWMAANKGRSHRIAAIHALVYTIPFLILQPSWTALAIICGSHFIIDRWQLSRFVVYAKHLISPPSQWYRWKDVQATGFPPSTPPSLAVGLLIVIDGTLHLISNYIALRFF